MLDYFSRKKDLLKRFSSTALVKNQHKRHTNRVLKGKGTQLLLTLNVKSAVVLRADTFRVNLCFTYFFLFFIKFI